MKTNAARKATIHLAAAWLALCLVLGCRHLPMGPRGKAAGGAELRLPGVFSSHMILQRGVPVRVWGWARAGENVTVRLVGRQAAAVADDRGRWRVQLPAMASGGPCDMTVRGSTRSIRLTDILIGDVWVCSGQSNMEWTLRNCLNGEEEIAQGDYPKIRLLKVPRRISSEPVDDVDADWRRCSPESLASAGGQGFSALAYFFGREIHRQTGVPVGLIDSSWGGTIAETWISREAVALVPGQRERLAELDEIVARSAETQKEYDAKRNSIAKARRALLNAEADEGLARKMTDPNLDTRKWKTMELPEQWEKAGLPDFNGLVWFRKTVDIPSSWQGKDLMLNLGPIDEIDLTWFNGTNVGGMGSFRDNVAQFWNTPRQYRVPASLVKPGPNVIAVRAVDTLGAGGLWGRKAEEMTLSAIGEEKARSLSVAGAWLYQPGPEAIALPDSPYSPNHPTLLYNGMIHPLVPFPIRGAIWYQGESNLKDGMLYAEKMRALINCWREIWDLGDLPFYLVQLAPFRYGGDPFALPKIWEAQTSLLSLPNTGMAVITDIGNLDDIHPKNKQEVGRRLALWALAKVHGRSDIVYSGPLYKSMAVEGEKIRLRFDHAAGGLASRDGKPLDRFEIAGEDRQFAKARAEIDGETLLVSSSAVSRPVAVRFGWHQEAEPNFISKEGLPASPFRTDRW